MRDRLIRVGPTHLVITIAALLTLFCVPASSHGFGASTLYEMLCANERGEPLSIDVVNVDDWAARNPRRACYDRWVQLFL